MKKLQKLLSVLIAAALMVSMVPTVFAEGTEEVTPPTLIEDNANVNQESQEEADQLDVQDEAPAEEAPAEEAPAVELIAPTLDEVRGNVDITWARSETALSASGKLDFDWASDSIDWKWSDVSELTTTETANVWNGETDHSSAKWSGAGMNRFTGTFAIPEGYSTNDKVHLASIVQDAYTNINADIDTMPILPINDDIFVFLYEEGEAINDTNFMKHLAFWSGVENQNDVITFNSVPGTAVKHFISGSAKAPFEVQNPIAAAALKVSDGWACAAPLDNIGETLFKNYPNADQNKKFVIDIFTYDTSALGGGGGMDELVMNFTHTNNYSATIRYWKDAVGTSTKDTNFLGTLGLDKGLSYRQKITLTDEQRNEKKPAGGLYKDGVQTQTPFVIVADKTKNIINVVYTAFERHNVIYTLGSNVRPDDFNVPATVSALENASVTVDTTTSSVEGTLNGVRGSFTFSGWTTEDAAVENGIFTMPNDDVTFTGSWTFTAEKTYSVTYQFADGTDSSLTGFLPNPASTGGHYKGDSVKQARPTQETLEVKNGEGTVIGAWTFSGWGPDIAAKNDDITVDGSGNFTMPNRDVVFVGSWTYSDYAKVTFYHYYGISSAGDYDTGDTVYLPQNDATLTNVFINSKHDTEDLADKFHTDDAIRTNHGKIEPRGFEARVYMAPEATRATDVEATFTDGPDGHMVLTGVREARVHLMYDSYYPVTVEIDHDGTISVAGEQHADPNFANYYLGVYRDATVTYTAADGYRVVSVTDNGREVAKNGTYVLPALANKHAIVVKTEINPDPTPDPDPTPTPTPDPDPTPTPDPDPTPTPDPDPTPTPRPDPKPDPTPVIPVPPVDPVDPAVPEILPDDPTPLAPAPDTAGGDTVIIIDEDTPLGNLPQTGMQDKRNLSAAGMAAMGLSALLTLAGFFFKKRQENG